jgi:major vault protein
VSKRFVPVDLAKAKQLKPLAPEGWYIILKNPGEDKDPAKIGDQPEEGKKARMPPLRGGYKVNIPGPTMFALWPGQMAQVVQGHHLRQDEYLIARVYNGDAAKRSFDATAGKAQARATLTPESFTPGHLFIIKGTEEPFYIPPTGIEVVRDPTSPRDKPKFVRSAVSLERLEYCLLRDQDGNKRYVRGPAVVFPEPTEEFITNARPDGTTTRKFKAIELGPKNGIHVKVIADYEDEATKEVIKAGAELFITGNDTPIYFPREEHAIIKYGDSDVNFGVAIPPGEARYVLQRLTGEIRLEKGPQVFLPDPRTELIVRRVLDQRLCGLMYPGNAEALAVNQKLSAAAAIRADLLTPVGAAPAASTSDAAFLSVNMARAVESAAPGFHGDALNRQGQYRPPRTITLDSKYDGAVTMDIHEGYAVMLVTKRGNRRVVVGPQTALLEYDEVPHVLTLSTGKPKTMDRPYKTVYLQIANNYVTDIVDVETRDYCKVKLKLSYRLNFEGANQAWFSVENYVKLLCDHMRSMIRNAVRHMGIKDFYHDATDVLRDLILGAAHEADETGRGQRSGRVFEENGMRIFDVEVLDVTLEKDLQALLEVQERASITQALQLEELTRKAEYTSKSVELSLAIAQAETQLNQRKEEFARQRMDAAAETKGKELEIAKGVQDAQNEVAESARAKQVADHELALRIQTAMDELKLSFIREETAATRTRMEAISPNLISALTSFGDQASIERLASAMGAQGFLRTVGGESVVDVLTKILAGSSLAERLPAAMNGRATATSKQLTP